MNLFSTCPVVGNGKKMNTVCDANAIAHIIKDSLFAELDGLIAFVQHKRQAQKVFYSSKICNILISIHDSG